MKLTIRSMAAAGAAMTAALAVAPAAYAAVAPVTLKVTPTNPSAGSIAPFTTALTFSPSGNDSVKDLTLHLPPGLLSNANVDGGKCLTEPGNTPSNSGYTPDPNCLVGTGTVTATSDIPLIGGLLPLPALSVNVYLVAPPNPASDLAGLQIEAQPSLPVLTSTTPLGPPADVSVSSTDASLTAAFHDIPNQLPLSISGLPPALTTISITQLSTTLSQTRFPTTCGSQTATVSGDTYNGARFGPVNGSFTPTGCAALPLTPKFTVTAVKDAADSGVQVVTDLQQPASPPQAVARTTALTLPGNVLAPNVLAVLTGGILCANPPTGCKPVGSATSVSPLYPKPLVGTAYLTGTLAAPAIELMFPPPFALTLKGAVDITNGTTTFTGIPDLPQSDLKVTLTGGIDSAFVATCAPSSGTASAVLTAQAGAPQATVQDPFTVTGCTAPPAPPTPTPPASGGGTPPPPPPPHHAPKPGRPQLTALSASGLGHGLVSLRMRVLAGRSAPKLRVLVISVPHGLSLRHAKGRGHRLLTTVYVNGARVRKLRVVAGRLVILLGRAASVVNVRVAGLGEARPLERQAERHRLHSVRLAVAVTDAKAARTALSGLIRKLSL